MGTYFKARTERFIVDIRTMEMNVSENEALGTVRIVDPGGDVIGVIADVAPLRRDSDAFQVVSPGFAISLQRNLGVSLHSHV